MSNTLEPRWSLIRQISESYIRRQHPELLDELKAQLAELGPESLEPAVQPREEHALSPVELALSVVMVPFVIDVVAGLVTEELVRIIEAYRKQGKQPPGETEMRRLEETIRLELEETHRTSVKQVTRVYRNQTDRGEQVEVTHEVEVIAEETRRVVLEQVRRKG